MKAGAWDIAVGSAIAFGWVIVAWGGRCARWSYLYFIAGFRFELTTVQTARL